MHLRGQRRPARERNSGFGSPGLGAWGLAGPAEERIAGLVSQCSRGSFRIALNRCFARSLAHRCRRHHQLEISFRPPRLGFGLHVSSREGGGNVRGGEGFLMAGFPSYHSAHAGRTAWKVVLGVLIDDLRLERSSAVWCTVCWRALPQAEVLL